MGLVVLGGGGLVGSSGALAVVGLEACLQGVVWAEGLELVVVCSWWVWFWVGFGWFWGFCVVLRGFGVWWVWVVIGFGRWFVICLAYCVCVGLCNIVSYVAVVDGGFAVGAWCSFAGG